MFLFEVVKGVAYDQHGARVAAAAEALVPRVADESRSYSAAFATALAIFARHNASNWTGIDPRVAQADYGVAANAKNAM